MRIYWLRLASCWRTVLLLLVLVCLLAFAGSRLLALYHLHAGQEDLERDHAAEALGHFQTCLRIWPASAEVHLLAARAARRDGDYQQAREHLEACRRLEENPPPEVALEGALLQAAMGYVDAVEETLEDWLEREPDLAPLIWDALALGYARIYRIRDSLMCLERWLSREPDNVRALFLRGNVYRQLRGYRRATPDYQRVVQLDPEQPQARWWLAMCLGETGRFQDAVKHLEILRKQGKRDAELLVLLARYQSRVGQQDSARNLLDAVLAKDPEHGLALRARGQLARLEGNVAEAESWLARAARIMPNDYETQWALFQVLQKQGKQEAAKQSARVEFLKKRQERLAEIGSREMSQKPHDPALHCEMGQLLIELGHNDLGQRWLQSALQQDPNYTPAHAALAAWYLEQGNMEKADYHRKMATP